MLDIYAAMGWSDPDAFAVRIREDAHARVLASGQPLTAGTVEHDVLVYGRRTGRTTRKLVEVADRVARRQRVILRVATRELAEVSALAVSTILAGMGVSHALHRKTSILDAYGSEVARVVSTDGDEAGSGIMYGVALVRDA